MRWFHRSSRILAVALVPLTVMGTGLARADNLLGNDLNTGGNATKAAGSAGTATFFLDRTGSEPCKATADSPVAVAVTSSQSWLTVDSPASVSLTACGTAAARTIGYRLLATAPVGGKATVSGSATGGLAAGNLNNGPGKFTVTVSAPADTTPPVLNLPGAITAEATSSAGAVATYSATATDNLDGPLAPSCTPASGSTFALGSSTVTCTATDAHGNSSTGSFTVTVRDTTGPSVTVPTAITTEATSAAGRVVTFAASASDTVDGVVAATCAPLSGSTFALGTATVTCRATDAGGNAGAASFAVTVRDTTAPLLSLPSDITTEATGPDGAGVTWSATSSDAVDGSVPVSCRPTSGAMFPLGRTSVACSAADANGNIASGSFDILVLDTTEPVLDLPDDVVTEATGPAGAVVNYAAGASDTVGGAVVPNCEPASGSTFPIMRSTVTCTAGDAAGNTSTGGFDVTVRDTTAPTLVTPDELTVEAASAAGGVATFTATARDIVDGDVATTCSTVSGSTLPLGETVVTCTATDAHGNTGQRSFPVVVVDTTAPDLAVPPAVSAEATSGAGATVSWDASSADLVGGPITPECTPASGATFALGGTEVTCTATDAAGNQASASFTVTVVDTTPPNLSLPDDVIVEATGPTGAAVTFSTTASDLVDGAVTPACTPAAGTTFALGTTTVSCTATDVRGNDATGSFTVSVVDTTPPAVVVPGDMVVEATSAGGADVAYSASAIDVVDEAVQAFCLPPSGSTFALGDTVVSCTASDAAGNDATESFTVTVRDTTAPVLSLPSDFTVEATAPSGAVADYEATSTDRVDGPVAVRCAPLSGSTFALGGNLVTCSAKDAAGNEATGRFTVSVEDHTPPGLHLPEDITAEATGPDGAQVNYTATATDLVDGDVTTTCAPPSGAVFPITVSQVGCSAADARDNLADGTFSVTVQDTTAPRLTVPGDMTVEATSAAGAVATYLATADDIVDGDVIPVCSRPSGSTFALGTTTVSCTATDTHGNAAAMSFRVAVRDTTPPALILPAAITAEATGPAGAGVSFTASATDLVDGPVPVSCTSDSGSTFALGTTTVGCSVTDSRGNSASNSFTVTVVDTNAPVVTVADVHAVATGGSTASVRYSASADDAVSGTLVPVCTPASGSVFPVGSTTVSCSATDSFGNTGHASAVVKVAYDFRGFFRPVDNPTVLNQVKAGQAVPVKFSLGGNQGLAVFLAGHPASGVIACNDAAPIDAVDQTTTAGSSSLSYDAGTDTYNYVWKTDKAWANTCRQLVVKLADGSPHWANFKFVR